MSDSRFTTLERQILDIFIGMYAYSHGLVVDVNLDGRTFSFFDDGIMEDSNTWGDVMLDELESITGVTPKIARGILSSLSKKGILLIENGSDGSVVRLTQHAVEVIAQLALEAANDKVSGK